MASEEAPVETLGEWTAAEEAEQPSTEAGEEPAGEETSLEEAVDPSTGQAAEEEPTA